MALPAHLARYDRLLDALVDAVVREIEADSQAPDVTTPELLGGMDSGAVRRRDDAECNPVP